MATRDLLSGPITLSAARDRVSDVLHELKYPRLKQLFLEHLQSQNELIRDTIAHHLGEDPAHCKVFSPQYWKRGSFNVCIPAEVDAPNRAQARNIMIRFPQPYRIGEITHAGNADEKLRCEAATYAWLQEHCPTVPIPHLYGIGLSTGQKLTHVNHLPWWSRWLHGIQRYFRTLFGYPCPTQYIPHKSRLPTLLGSGYLIIETVPMTEGSMLSTLWEDDYQDERLQNNLQRGIARILLSLSAVPLPRIGAFRLDDAGYIHLDNRPLTAEVIMQENEGFPRTMPRCETYSRADDLVIAHLDAFENRLLHQPNAVPTEKDGQFDMAALFAARALFPRMLQNELRSGSFVCTLTDLHRSNILVDEDWNVVRIIDLEFACSWPIEFQQPPYWLGGLCADEIDRDSFKPHHDRFIQIMEEEEYVAGTTSEKLSAMMRRSWENEIFWLSLAIQDPVVFPTAFWYRLLPYQLGLNIDDTTDYPLLARFLEKPDVIEKKVQEHASYLQELEIEFRQSESDPSKA